MIYLAGPMIFFENQQEIFEQMKAILRDLGPEGVSPPPAVCLATEAVTPLHGTRPGRATANSILVTLSMDQVRAHKSPNILQKPAHHYSKRPQNDSINPE